MTSPKKLSAYLIGITLLVAGCSEEKSPPRDQIPILRERLYSLEQVILRKDRAAIDSLLSTEILDYHESSDSLLNFVYGSDRDRSFVRLGDYQIFYNFDLAVATCYLMDSLGTKDRPVKFTFKKDDGVWLLKKFEPWEKKEESDTTAW